MQRVEVNAEVDRDLHQFITEICSTYTFQLKLTSFNFTSKHQTFTISRIFTVLDRPPVSAFVIEGGSNVPQAKLPGVDTKGSAVIPSDDCGVSVSTKQQLDQKKMDRRRHIWNSTRNTKFIKKLSPP